MSIDAAAVPFFIPARDALGREHVEGQLVAAVEELQLHWRFRHRTFKQKEEEMKTVRIAYSNVQSIGLKRTLGWFKPRLVLQLVDPAPLAGVPGTGVGRAELLLAGRREAWQAESWLKLLDYRRSEASLKENRARLSDLENDGARPDSL